jgi:hypothetical protein
VQFDQNTRIPGLKAKFRKQASRFNAAHDNYLGAAHAALFLSAQHS